MIFRIWFPLLVLFAALALTQAIFVQSGSSLLFGSLWKKKEKEEASDDRQPVLVLDIDGTLYEDDCNVESQIRDLIFQFADKTLQISPEDMQSMYTIHHSNLKGLLQVANFSSENQTEKADFLRKFYHDCYHNLDYSKLSRYQPGSGSSSMLTGYHNSDNMALALQSLRSLPYPIVIATNSPMTHAQKVLARIGLADLPVAMFLTPDTIFDVSSGHVKTDPAFWDKLLATFPPSQYICTLVDDRSLNLKTVSKLGLKTLHVNSHQQSEGFAEAIAAFVANPYDPKITAISDEGYLLAKNIVDKQAMNSSVSQALVSHLSQLMTANKQIQQEALSVLDLGAGLCPMLSHLLQLLSSSPVKSLRYAAVEGNHHLSPAIARALTETGLHIADKDSNSNSNSNSITATGRIRGIAVEVTVLFADFMQDSTAQTINIAEKNGRFDLIVGMGLADLFPAAALLGRVRDYAHEESLLYLPIVFDGQTRLLHSRDDQTVAVDIGNQQVLPVYHQSLARRGHHLHNPSAILSLLPSFGYDLLASGQSNWIVSATHNSYLFKALLWFIRCGVGITRPDLDLTSWYRSLLGGDSDRDEVRLEVENVDILARIKPLLAAHDLLPPAVSPTTKSNKKAVASKRSVVEFTAPFSVQVKEEAIPLLQADEFLLETSCSMVSAGTELKVFRGQMISQDGDEEEDEALDVSIKALEGKKMKYPLRYGYSLVGRVTATTTDRSNVKIGQRLFAFAPHATATILSSSSSSPGGFMSIPDEIQDEDAVFLPAIETAFSLVMSAGLLPGEHVLVAGQGLIGLLVAAVVKATMPTIRLTVADVSTTRLTAAKVFLDSLQPLSAETDSFNLISYWNPAVPNRESEGEGFDAAIEVTGRMAGLQLAVDHARYGGRVVAGSWYDKKDSHHLKLGTQFHRGNVRIVSSQVSRIAGGLSDRWSKQRRFAACWPLIKQIRPSRLLPQQDGVVDMCSTKEVQAAFEKLHRGELITVLLNNTRNTNKESDKQVV